MTDSERTPLLAEAGTAADGEPHNAEPAVKTDRWFARNAVALFASLLVLAVLIVLAVFFGVSRSSHPPASAKARICQTPACVHASSEILYNLAPNYKELDACTNFDELVCGGWQDRHDLRPDQGATSTLALMQDSNQMLLRHILEAPYPDTSDHSTFSPAQLLETMSSVDRQNFDKLKTAYDACLDEDTIKKEGTKPLLEILHQVADMFPVNGSAFETKSHLETRDSDALSSTMTYLNDLGLSPLLAIGAGADDKDPDTVVVQISPPRRIGLPAKDYYQNEKVVQKYTDAIASIIQNLYPNYKSKSQGKTGPGSKATDHAQELVAFEKKLSAASPDAEDADDVTKYYNPMLLKDATKLTPAVQLSAIVKKLSPSDANINRIIVASPDYMKNLTEILSSTSDEVIQSYFMWKVVQAYYTKVEAEEIKPYAQFVNELQGTDPNSVPERWRVCVSHVDNGLGWILSRFFVEKAFSEKAKKFGDQIISDIKDMFIEKLEVTAWMDKSVIKLAIEKVHKIVQKIGYPTKSPNIMDPPSLRDYYLSVNVTPTSYFKNSLSMNRLEVAREWSSLGRPVDREQWDMTVPTVNAYYNPPGNEIVFPAGIMQFPVFDVKVPQYLSYGAFGAVSGHELSHAFDSTGRHYDQNGNYTDWWTKATVKGFKERADCFVDQYSQYSVPGPDGKPLHVNGKLTLGENIADAGGVTAAFGAWRKRQAETPNEDLPGLSHFTQDQLFFVSYANAWCDKSRNETAINRIYTDPHSPKWVRILGTMANSKDFRESFKCAQKQPTCELW